MPCFEGARLRLEASQEALADGVECAAGTLGVADGAVRDVRGVEGGDELGVVACA